MQIRLFPFPNSSFLAFCFSYFCLVFSCTLAFNMDKPVTKIPTTKGKQLAEIDGSLYYLDKVSGTTSYYRCIHYKRNCPARAIAKNNICTSKDKKPHRNHFSDHDRAARYQLMDQGKKIATENVTMPISEVLATMEQMQVSTSDECPKMVKEASVQTFCLQGYDLLF